MNEDDKLFLVLRFLAAGSGMFGGAISGTILIILLMVFTGSTLALTNIWPGTVVGAVMGAVLGFLFPKIGKALLGFFGRVQ